MAYLLDKPFTERKRNILVLMIVFFTEILFRVLIERLLASERAEVIRLPVIFRRASGGGGIDIHVADGIVYSGCHKLVSFIFH